MTTLLDVKNLSIKRSWGRSAWLYAVDDASFEVQCGETLAIVDESGSGKTAPALGVARLVHASGGSVDLGGQDFLKLEPEALRQAHAKVQVIFQDPYSSLNPRLRAEAIVREPMASIGTLPKAERPVRVAELFEQVGLCPEQMKLFPQQFSDGQRQRIAHALSTKALLSAVPSVDQKRKVERILIPGDPPDPLNPPAGCRFASRCPFVEDACLSAQPPLDAIASQHKVACIKASR